MSNKNMMLYLTTRGRPDEQLTLESLPQKWRERTIVVCPGSEAKQFSKDWPELYDVKVPKVKDLAEKRAWIFTHCPFEKILMLDDDLRFYVRRTVFTTLRGFEREMDQERWRDIRRRHPSAGALYRPEDNGKRVSSMLSRLEWMLGIYAHGGISDRFMNQERGSEFIMNGRYLHVLGYHVPTVLANCERGRILLSSDYDYALQLMQAGYESAVYSWGAQEDPNGFNAPGGVSSYRTAAKIAMCSQQLADLHPGIVSVVPYKKGSKYEHLGVRTRANWQRAIREGLTDRGTKYGTISGHKS